MKSLRLVRKNVAKFDGISSYKLGLEIIASQDIPREVFVKQRLRDSDNNINDIFVAVCTPAQLEEFSVLSPNGDSSFFRTSEIELVASSESYLEELFDNITFDIQNLLDSADVLSDFVSSTTYDYTADQASVSSTTIGSPGGSKTITIESPSNAEDLIIFYSIGNMQILRIVAIVLGTASPSVTWTIIYDSSPSGTGTELITGGTITTNASNLISFNNPNIPSDKFIRIKTTATAGNVDELSITIIYT